MTDLYEDWKDRSLGAPAIAADLKQFQKLQHLDDEAVAFRMASTVVEVRRLRKMFGQSNIKLVNTKLPYQLRLLLGHPRCARSQRGGGREGDRSGRGFPC